MATIHLNGKPVHTSGELPEKGTEAADWVLTKRDLSDVTLKDFTGKKKILNIVSSLDTGRCPLRHVGSTRVRSLFQTPLSLQSATICLLYRTGSVPPKELII